MVRAHRFTLRLSLTHNMPLLLYLLSGANEEAIKLIVENTEKYGQGYFAYSAHKSGGVTMSHLRFGDHPINSTYRIQNADLISVHTTPYLKKFPQLLDPLKDNGTVILNSPWTTLEQIEKALPNFVKRKIAKRKAKLYNVDATAIAKDSGLRGRINMIMQGAFFKVIFLSILNIIIATYLLFL